ncbi:MAG: type VI secretion system protein TssA [Hydrogenophaga sp.]|nr:type VI secretion system protein TssA [Hydrogenophaga sp.]
MIDNAALDRLLAPVSDSSPCGDDLEYDLAFIELQNAATGKPEQQFGDTVIPGEAPEWRVVLAQASALLERSKDLRVAALLMRSATRLGGVPSFVLTARWLNTLLQRYWDGIHPMLDADDDNDPTMRVNALQALADGSMLVADLREAVVANVRGLGPVRVKDIEVALGAVPGRGDDGGMTQEQVSRGLSEALTQQPDALDAALECASVVAELQQTVNDRCGRGDLLDLSPLRRPAHVVQQLCRTLKAEVLGGADGAAAAADVPVDGALSLAGAPVAAAAHRGIASREDAIRTLDRVIEFLEKNEPSNPAPLLIQRAKRLIGASFMDIMADLAPDAVSGVEHISGRRSNDSS